MPKWICCKVKISNKSSAQTRDSRTSARNELKFSSPRPSPRWARRGRKISRSSRFSRLKSVFHPCESVAKNSVLHRVGFQRFQIHEFQDGNVAGFQHYGTGVTRFKRLRPAPHANAPAVAGRQTGEIVFGARGDKVVALQRQILEKWLGDLATHGMQPAILRPSAAKAVAIKPGYGRVTAAL